VFASLLNISFANLVVLAHFDQFLVSFMGFHKTDSNFLVASDL